MEGRVISMIDYGLLGMALISSVSCLARADFNFVFSLVTYYLWNSLRTKENEREDLGKKIIILNLGLIVLDLVCIVSLTSAWGNETDEYASIHGFVLFVSWINFFVRVFPN